MKKILLLVFLFMGFQIAATQAQCDPDPQYADASAGVYPLPDTVGSPMSSLPMGFENQPYELVFTAVVPDTTTIELTPGNPASLDLDNVTLLDIEGLPPGLSYVCNPPDCIFPDESQGCVKISGTPTQAGTYSLLVNTTVGVGVAMLPITFPGTLVSGEYKIVIDEDTSTETAIEEVIGLGQNAPNPFHDKTEITIDIKQSGEFEFNVYNILGKLLHNRRVVLSAGKNVIQYNGSQLHSGMYFYSIGQGNEVVTRRMVVHRP